MARLPLWLNTRTVSSHLFFGPYIFIPLLGGLTWLGGILALLALWVKEGKPRYRGDEASVVFISDVGAVHHTLFICICCVTGGLYVLALFAERWLRHIDRLPVTLRIVTKVLDGLAIFFGIVGAVGLILLSIFDTFHHSTIHWSMTLVFVVGVAISAIFQLAEIWTLHQTHPDRKSLLRNAIIKIFIVVIAVATAIAFGSTYAVCGGNATATNGHSATTCNRITSVAAALEWTVAFILFFFFMTLVADLWPAGKSSPRYMRRLARWQETHGEGDDFTGRRAFEKHPERWQERYAAMKRNMWDRNNAQEKRDSTTSHAPMVAGVGAAHSGSSSPRDGVNGASYANTQGYPATAQNTTTQPTTTYAQPATYAVEQPAYPQSAAAPIYGKQTTPATQSATAAPAYTTQPEINGHERAYRDPYSDVMMGQGAARPGYNGA